MKIEVTEYEGVAIGEFVSEQVILRETQDALDLMAELRYLGSGKMILHAENIDPCFFDLKTKLAGEILQKFSNYRMQLAIVGDFSGYRSKSLKDFITESNRTGRICFVESVEEARKRLLNH